MVLLDAGLKLRLLLLARGGSRSSGVPGLGLLLVVGLAGMVSRKRPSGGEDVSRTVCLFCGSTADVSQESNPSSVELGASRNVLESSEAGRRDERWLPGNSRVLDDMGRTTFESDDRIELMVSVAERPPLEPGGLGLV